MVGFGDSDFNNNANCVAFNRYLNTNSITNERNGFGAPTINLTYDVPFQACSVFTPTTTNSFVNGASNFSLSFTTKGSFNYSLYNIGRFSGSGTGVAGSFVWSGLIGEVIAYNRNLNRFERQLVEGYLAWKWGQRSVLPSTHPFYNDLPLMPKFDIRKIPAIYRLDAYDPLGTGVLPASGTPITTWADLSGSGNDVTQSTSSLAPTFNYDSSYPGLLFDGSTQYMTGPSSKVTATTFSVFIVFRRVSTTMPPNGTPTVFQVVKTIGTTIRSFEISSNYGSPSNQFYILSITNQGTGTGKFNYSAGSNNRSILSTTENAVNSATVFGWLNGNNMTVANIAGGTYATGDPYGIVLGANRFYLASPQYHAFHNGYIHEVLVFNTLTSLERQQVEGYLAWKWGLQANLPSTHAYAKYPPY
jgi:hypothetical protein